MRHAMRLLACGIGGLLAVGLADRAMAGDRALVIGVNQYPGITLQGIGGQKNLNGAVFDAKTFHTLLTSQFGVAEADIHVLLDAEATRARILSEIKDWLIGGTSAGDRVFFYFAGHGAAVRVEDEANGTSRMTSAIVPADAHGELTKQPLSIEGMVLGPEIHALLDQMADRKVTIMADSCQSGSISRDVSHPLVIPEGINARTLTPAGAVGMTTTEFAADTTLRRNAKLNGRLLEIEPDTKPAAGPGELVVWAAATTDQVTFDRVNQPGGIFTQSFAEGLRDHKAVPDQNAAIVGEALLNYVRDQAKAFCTKAGEACSAGLTPQLLAPADYLTAPLEAAAAAPPAADPAQPEVQNQPAAQDQPQQDQPAQQDLPAKPTLPAQPKVDVDAPPPDTTAKPEAQPALVKAKSDLTAAILGHHNDFSLQAQILPSNSLRIGQSMQYRIQSGESGKVALFDLTPDGELTQIFPNKKTDRAGHIRANAPLTMPDAFWGIHFHAQAPAGAGTLLVLVTEEGVDLSKGTNGALDFQPIKQTSRLLQVVAEELEKPVVSPKLEEPTRAARWAFVRVPYTVRP